MLPSSEIRKTGTRKMADRPSMATLNSAPGRDHCNTIGWLSPVAQNQTTPPKPSPAASTARNVVTHCPLIEVRLRSRPGTPLDAAIMIPRSTSDSLMTYPTSNDSQEHQRFAHDVPHQPRRDTQARASTTMNMI